MEKVVELVRKYMDVQLQLLSIRVEEEIQAIVSRLITLFLLVVLAGSLGLFLSITVALLINYFLNSTYWGFGIVTIFYALLLLGFISKRGRYLVSSQIRLLNRYFIYTEKNEWKDE
ncbi:MAG: hypothetical protein ACFB0B_03500 [Thermonemataceae bacterium]